MKKTFALLIVFIMIFAMMMPTYAATGGSTDGKDKTTSSGNGNGSSTDKGNSDKNVKTLEQGTEGTTSTGTDSTEATDKDKSSKETHKEQWKNLKDQFTSAAKENNAELKAQLKNQIKEFCEQYRLENKKEYTAEEAAKLAKVAEELKSADPSLTVLPVESIVTVGKKLKLDTPPVVKEGRVLVPVRALSSAYGADVQYNQTEKKITITRDGIVIVLQLESRTVLVNGVETQLDVPATSLNNRTVVPLRFIIEKLGLKVDYDEQTSTVIVDDGTSQTTETGSGTTDTSTSGSSTGSTGTAAGDTSTGTQTTSGTTTDANTSTGTGTNGQ